MKYCVTEIGLKIPAFAVKDCCYQQIEPKLLLTQGIASNFLYSSDLICKVQF